MGRSDTPTYRIEMTEAGEPFRTVMASNTFAWDRHDGRPSTRNIARYVAVLETSYQPGGVNEHIGRMPGGPPAPITKARIIRQKTGDVVAEWSRFRDGFDG